MVSRTAIAAAGACVLLALVLVVMVVLPGSVTPWCVLAAIGDPGQRGCGQSIHREFLSHLEAKEKKIELLWTKPDGAGPWPAIIFIHGHQEKREGGEVFVSAGRLRLMARRGYVAAAVSQPGYGNSDGPPDFCGPFTQEAVLAAIEFLRSKPFVKPNKMALYGYSRGAVVASMVATRDPRLATVILVAGAYDLEKTYPTGIQGIDQSIRLEAGTSAEAFKARSALHHVEKIKSPILLLHGASDDRFKLKPAQAEAFAQALMAHGVRVRIKIFPNLGHFIPIPDEQKEIDPFLEEYLR